MKLHTIYFSTGEVIEWTTHASKAERRQIIKTIIDAAHERGERHIKYRYRK